jgi:NAD+ synthase (glutamine-hydrolysing)
VLRSKVSSFAAKYLQVPLIYVNQIGANDNLIFDGNSFILDKNGYKIKQLKSFSEDLSSWQIEQTIPEKKNLNNLKYHQFLMH